MKSKFLKKLCVYAISASMVLPASAPVLAATTTSVVRDYSFNLLESSNSKVVKNMCNTCYADSRGNHYLKLKCQKKGTATITFQVYPKNTNKKVYVSKKIFRFKITVK